MVLAVTGDDEDNLVTSLLAKQEFGVPRVIARVNHPANEWMFTEMWGVDIAVSAPHLLSALVEEAVTVGSIVRLLPGGRRQGASDRGHALRRQPDPRSEHRRRRVPEGIERRGDRPVRRRRRSPW